MTIDPKALLKLSVEERIELMGQIWDSIAAEPDRVPVFEEVLDRVDERLAEHDHAPETAIPWRELRASLLGPE